MPLYHHATAMPSLICLMTKKVLKAAFGSVPNQQNGDPADG